MAAPDDAALSRATGAARATFVLSPLIAIVALASSVVVIRVLSPGDFALYAVAISLRATLQFLADMGTGAASTRSFAELQQAGARGQAWRLYSRLAGVRLMIVIVLVVVLVLNTDGAASLLELRSDEHFFLTFVALIGVAEVAAGLGYYALIGTFGHRAAYSAVLAQNLLQPVLVISASLAGLDLAGILGAVLAGSCLRAVTLNVLAVRSLRQIDEGGRNVENLGQTYAQVTAGSVSGKFAAWVHSRQVVSVIAISTVSRPQVAVFAAAYDFVHQAFAFISAPFYSLLQPAFAVAGRDDESGRRMLHMAVRGIALVALPLAALLTPVFTSLSVVLFGDEYSRAGSFALVLVPALAIELVLSGPATALMLARDPLIRIYRNVKLATLALGALYFALAGVDLLIVAGVMMAVRVASALALQGLIWRRTGIAPPVGWLARAIGVAVLAAAVAFALGHLLPGRWPDVFAAPLAAGAVYVLLLRLARLVEPEDLATAARIVPVAGGPLRLLLPERSRRDAGERPAPGRPGPAVPDPPPPYSAIE